MGQKVAHNKLAENAGPALINVSEGIQKLRDIEMFEWICHLIYTHPHRECPEDIPFTNTEK